MSSSFNNPTSLNVDAATGRLTVCVYNFDTNLLDWVPSTTNGGVSPGSNVNVTNSSIAVSQAGSWTVLGPLTDTQLRASSVNVAIASSTTVPVSGTFWQATQPVSLASMPTTPVTGTFWQATQPVSIASMPSTPVTGTFWQSTQPVSLAALPALPTGSATIGSVKVTDGTSTATIGNLTNNKALATMIVDGSGTQITSFGGGTQYADGTSQTTPTGTVALGKNASNVLHALSLDASGYLNINLAAGTITGGNAAASATGAAVPASAGYTGFNSGGNLVGVSTANPLPVAQQGSVAVTGTFWQLTQPISMAAGLPTGSNTIGGVAIPSTISTNNSTTANLGAAAVFTGTSEDVSNFSEVRVMVYSSHASATDGLSLQQSTDGTNWFQSDTYTIPATTAKVIGVGVAAKFFRLVYTNGGTLTTTLQIQTIFHTVATKPSSQRPSDGYSNEIDLEQDQVFPMLFNGTTWDRARGTSGSANVTLPATTGTGTLTAAAQTVNFTNTSGAVPEIHVLVYGTFNGTIIAEQSADNSTWYAGDSFGQFWASGTRVLNLTNSYSSDSFVYANTFRFFRVRCSAYTSGTLNVAIYSPNSASRPMLNAYTSTIALGDFNNANRVVNVKAASTAAVSGDTALVVALHPSSPLPTGANTIGSISTVTSVTSVTSVAACTTTPATPTASIINSAASTNGTVIKASAGTLYNITCSNSGTVAYVKFYNSTTVTVGTTTPAITITVPASGTVNIPFAVQGMRFGTGICLGITGAATDSDTTAVTAGQVKVLTSYI